MRKRYPHYKPSGVDWLGEVPRRSQQGGGGEECGLVRQRFNKGCRDLCHGGMVRGARRFLARRARAGQKRRAPEDPNGQERFHGGDTKEAHTARWSVILGPVPQRRQAAISVDPGEDDTEEGEAREPRQALGRLERIRQIVPGEQQGTCRGGQHQEAADPDGGGRDVQVVDELGQAEVAPGRGMPGGAVVVQPIASMAISMTAAGPCRSLSTRPRAIGPPRPRRAPSTPIRNDWPSTLGTSGTARAASPAHLCGTQEEEQGRRDRKPRDRGEQH